MRYNIPKKKIIITKYEEIKEICNDSASTAKVEPVLDFFYNLLFNLTNVMKKMFSIINVVSFVFWYY